MHTAWSCKLNLTVLVEEGVEVELDWTIHYKHAKLSVFCSCGWAEERKSSPLISNIKIVSTKARGSGNTSFSSVPGMPCDLATEGPCLCRFAISHWPLPGKITESSRLSRL